MKKIELFNLNENNQFQNSLIKKINKLITNKNFIKGKEVFNFEKKFSKSINIKYCVSCNSGTDALFLILRSFNIGKGDEVITTAQSWISTSEVIKNCNARPVFIDTNDDFNINENLIRKKITKKTKALIVVHLYGYPANIGKIKQICKNNNILLIEDCAQAYLSKYKNKFVGTFGDASAFSFFPTKNLGAFGDSGCAVTNDKLTFQKLRMLANHGSKDRKNFIYDGINSRMDTIQAIVLTEKLKKIKKEVIHKQKLSKIYYNLLKNNKEISLPKYKKDRFTNFHLFTIKANQRSKLKEYLKKNGIETGIYYDFLLPNLKTNKSKNLGKYQNAKNNLSKILSFPINKNLSKFDVENICKHVNLFYSKGK